MSATVSFSCLFCASIPFSDFGNFSDHFINTHRNFLFPAQDACSTDELRTLAELVVLFERNLPGLKWINIKLSTLVGCDAARFKRLKENVGHRRSLALARNPPVASVMPASHTHSPMLIDLEAADSCDPKAADLNQDISVIIDEIHNISTVLRDKSDSTRFSESISSSYNTLLPFSCLFCDRRFSTSSGLGLHKKSRHFDEFLLEI